MADHWSSLPDDLVRRVGDRLLATDDIDYYINMRAACRSWAAATDDPRKALPGADQRFSLRSWILLDEHRSMAEKGYLKRLLFLNTATGRFARMELPCLVANITSIGGLLVQAASSWGDTSSTRILNPFTGSTIGFQACIPSPYTSAELSSSTGSSLCHANAYLLHHVSPNNSPTLLLDRGPFETKCSAQTDDQQFSVSEYTLVDQVRAAWGSGADPETIDALVSSVISAFFPYGSPRAWFGYPEYNVIESPSGEKLLVIRRFRRERAARGVDVFEVDYSEGNLKGIRPTRSIGGRALFLGERSVFLDADKFPSVDGDCVFYRRAEYDQVGGIYKFDLGKQTEERVTYGVADLIWSIGAPSLVQMLIRYCVHLPCAGYKERL